jgi:HK97 family phage major capsid protein
MTIDEMRNRRKELLDKAAELQAKADAETRDLTADEATEQAELLEEVRQLAESIERRGELEGALKQLHEEANPTPGANRKCDPAGPKSSENDTPNDRPGQRLSIRTQERWVDDPRWGWRDMGEFARGVATAKVQPSQTDERITRAATTFGQEQIGADGGYAVPPQFAAAIAQEVEDEESLMGMAAVDDIESNSMVYPKDEATPWGSTGIIAAWEGEGATQTERKPALESATIKAHKLIAHVKVTDELLEDARALESYINRKAPSAIRFKIDLAVVQGTGAGEPLGFRDAPSAIAVTRASSNLVKSADVRGMWNRLYGPWRPNSVWICNQDVEPQLLRLYDVDTEGTPLSTWPVFLPPGGYSQAPYNTMMGRRVIFSQTCDALGSKGDISLAALSQYQMVRKAGGIRASQSIHLHFDQDITCFKFVLRVGGQPMWDDAISPRSGSNTYSAFVVLAA